MDPDGKPTSTRAVLSAAGQNRRPPAGTYMAATGQDLMAADSRRPPTMPNSTRHTNQNPTSQLGCVEPEMAARAPAYWAEGNRILMVKKSIGEWHSRLHEHFLALRDSRDALSPGSPVFALEHGLELDDELSELNDVVRRAVTGGRLPSHAWLPLVVYAAEIGYRYQGDEYWPVFVAETPGWARRGTAGREYIRKKYELFASAYGGARPSGVWAAWFKNIAWPITHAVLPADLQKHLVRLLFEYRHAFTLELLVDHEGMGERLAARSGETSSRFRKFAEDTPLLGLVACSLLLRDEDEAPQLSAEVMRRIVADLSHERQAGDWLRTAKRAAVSVRRKGLLGRSLPPREDRGSDVSDQRWPKLELTLSLRRSDEGWSVYAMVPSFESIAYRFPSAREELKRLRCRIDGVPSVRPRGSMMYRQGPLALRSMPPPNRTPIRVEGGSAALSELLVDHCRVPAEPWLFRIGEPGLAQEVRTNCVRPGEEYILLADGVLHAGGLSDANGVDITTDGVEGLQFSVPVNVDDAFIQTMRQMGLGLVSDLVVWPAGLVPSSWDREGRAAWPAGESPIMGVRSARRVARCVVSTSEDVMDFAWPVDGDTVFFQLTDLGIGVHLVDVLLLDANEPPAAVAQGRVVVRIMEPVDSTAAAGARQAIQTWAYPARPSLDELWRSSAALLVDGPRGENAHFEVRLMTRGGRQTLAKKSFSSSLPVGEDRWRELLRGVQGDPDLESEIGRAEELLVVISNPVLGFAEIRAERPFARLRWITGHDRDGPFARLVDPVGSDDLHVSSRDVNYPAKSVQVVLPETGEIRLEAGGLVVASADGYQAAVVLRPHLSGGLEALRKLRARPSLQTGNPSGQSVRRMIELAHLWTRDAVAADQYAARLQSQVNDAIVARTSGMIAGGRWWDVEREVLDDRSVSRERLLRAIGSSQEERAAAGALLDNATSAGTDPEERTAAFVQSLAATGSWGIAEFAGPILRLGTDPGSIDLSAPDASAAIGAVLERPALLRLARVFALAIDRLDDASHSSLLEDWAW